MKAQIVSKNTNKLLKREDLLVRIDHEGTATPQRKDILPHLVNLTGKAQDLIIIDTIATATGKAVLAAKVQIYTKKEDIPAHKMEKMKKELEKGKKKQESSEQEAPTEEKPAEQAPSEESKEEKPEEPEKKEENPSE